MCIASLYWGFPDIPQDSTGKGEGRGKSLFSSPYPTAPTHHGTVTTDGDHDHLAEEFVSEVESKADLIHFSLFPSYDTELQETFIPHSQYARTKL